MDDINVLLFCVENISPCTGSRVNSNYEQIASGVGGFGGGGSHLAMSLQ